MVRIRNPDLVLGADAAFPPYHHAGDPRQVRLESDHLQIEQQFRVVGKQGGNAGRFVDGGSDLPAVGFSFFNAPFDFADRIQVSLSELFGVDPSTLFSVPSLP